MDFHKLWKKELECKGRDYAGGIRLPFYVQQLGLQDIDIHMNDKVMYVNPDMPDYEEEKISSNAEEIMDNKKVYLDTSVISALFDSRKLVVLRARKPLIMRTNRKRGSYK